MSAATDFAKFHEDSAAQLEEELWSLRSLPAMRERAKTYLHQLSELDQALADAGNTDADIDSFASLIQGLCAEAPGSKKENSSPAVGGVLTAAEILADEIPEALVERLVHRHSITTVTGASKAGKSVSVTQMMMSIATGRHFLGLGTKKAKVLYISLEMTAALMRDRMEAISGDTGTPMPDFDSEFALWAPTATKLAALDIVGDEGRRVLADRITEGGYEAIAMDTLYKFTLGADPNENKEMGPVFAGLADVAQETGAAIVVVDHAGKGQQGGPVSHSAIGASIKGGASRTIAALRREGEGWSMDVESHFGNWDDPISYVRPRLRGDSLGFGCVRSSAADVRGIEIESVRRVFQKCAEGNPPTFATQGALIDGLRSAEMVDGDSQDAGQKVVYALVRSFGSDRDAEPCILAKRPIWITRGGRGKATQYEWNEPAYQRLTGVTGPTGATA